MQTREARAPHVDQLAYGRADLDIFSFQLGHGVAGVATAHIYLVTLGAAQLGDAKHDFTCASAGHGIDLKNFHEK